MNNKLGFAQDRALELIGEIGSGIRKAMPGKVMARHLLRMLDTVELSRLDVQDMRAALASDWPDLEDAIQHRSALASGQVDAIVSHDADMKRHAELPVLSPRQVLQRLAR